VTYLAPYDLELGAFIITPEVLYWGSSPCSFQSPSGRLQGLYEPWCESIRL